MHRQEILSKAGKAAGLFGIAATVGGVNWARKAYARSQMTAWLVSVATGAVTATRVTELREIPVAAREEIQAWFQAPCVNAREFAVNVTFEAFRTQLYRSPDDEAKRLLFLNAFLRHVTSDVEIVDHLRVVAEEVGARLDNDWHNCCLQISKNWQLDVDNYRSRGTLEDRLNVENLVENGIERSLKSAAAASRSPVLVETTDKIGRAAILLLPLASIPVLTLPLFIAVAVGHLYDYFVGLTTSHVKEVQAAVSAQLAILSNRIGTELEVEVRTNVARLHDWQDQALASAAQSQAEKTLS